MNPSRRESSSSPPTEEEKEENPVLDENSLCQPPTIPERPRTPPTPGAPEKAAAITPSLTWEPSLQEDNTLTPLWTESVHSVGYRRLMAHWVGALSDTGASLFRLEDYCPLPLICVMGDTSSGKSTVLSQLTGIALPAHCQLTTKCPTLLQLQPSPSSDDHTGGLTKATVSIQWHASTVGKPDLPVFAPQTVTEWHVLPSVIQRAQTFLLDAVDKNVAPDRVVVQIEGPTCPNLTLVDLPGSVHTATANESPALPSDIRVILDEYWDQPEALFLVVVPSNVDVHNAELLARALRKGGVDRTIPVLTKPDLIDAGAERVVCDLLTGKTQPLQSDQGKTSPHLEFHIVKGRGQAALDRKDSLSDALMKEQNYFATTEPWKSVGDRSLLGTAQLRTKLANRQFLHIQKAVGPALQRLQNELANVTAILENLGVPLKSPADRRRLYQEVCQSFVSHLHCTLSGKGRVKRDVETADTASSLSAAAALHEACRDFMEKIRQGSLATIQKVVEGAHVLVTSRHDTVHGEVVHLDTDFCCVDYVDPVNTGSPVLFEATRQTSLESMEENDVWSDGTNIHIARGDHVYDTLRKIPLNCVRTDPSWLKDLMAQHRTDDLACFLNVDVFHNIIQDLIEVDWRPHCGGFLDQLRDILARAVREAWQATLSQCRFRRYQALQTSLWQGCRRVQTDLLQSAQQQVESHLRTERHPYTQDDVLFRSLAEARQRALRQELHVALGLETSVHAAGRATDGIAFTKNNEVGKALSTTAIADILDQVFTRHQNMSVEDHLAAEMEMVLASYGEIATRRVIDRTPMIGWEVFRSLTDALQVSLWSVTDDQLVEYFREEDEVVQQYDQLRTKQEQLRKVITVFQALSFPAPLSTGAQIPISVHCTPNLFGI